jgi:hypothetical protein
LLSAVKVPIKEGMCTAWKREGNLVPIVQLNDPDTYDKAVAVLLRRGGSFSGREPQVLVVNPTQFQALVEEGIVEPQRPPQERPHGKNKTKT